jgi:glycerol uptake facilitator-like aquaporin
MYRHFIDFIGTLVILYTLLLTDRNPTLMGLIYFAVYSIGKENHNPLASIASWAVGRRPLRETLIDIGVQVLAMFFIIVTFLPVKTFMEHV